MARTKIKHRSYKNATNPQAENSPEPENVCAEVPDPLPEVPDSTQPEEDGPIIPLPIDENPPDPLPEIENPPSPTRAQDFSVSYMPASSTSTSSDGLAFPIEQDSPASPVNLSRHSPTPGCSRDLTPVRIPEYPITGYNEPSTSYYRPSTSYVDRDTPSPQPGTSYASDLPPYYRPRSPTEPVPGSSRDFYPRPGTSSMIDHTYNSSPSSPVNLSWNSPIPGSSRDSAFQPRPSTGSPPVTMSIWDAMKENCQKEANAAAKANYRPRTPDMNAVPVDDIFSPNTQQEIRSSIRDLFPNGPPPLPLIRPIRRPKKSEIPYIVGCTKRARVPSPTCLTVFQGDRYGITSDTNDDDDESSPAKRGRRNPGIPGYSKSRFNAQSDDIASRLKLHDKIDTLLGRGTDTQDEPVGYVIRRNIPRRFSPLPSTSTDSETIMKNDKHFSQSLGQDSDLDDEDDELPAIVWDTRRYREPPSRNVSPLDLNDTINDSQTDDGISLILNEDANNNNDLDYNYDMHFDKYIPKEKLVQASDLIIVDPRPAGGPRIVDSIDLQNGYIFKAPNPVTPAPTGDVIYLEDAILAHQNDANDNVIEIPDPLLGDASSTNGNVIEIPDHLPGNASSTNGNVIEIPDHLPGNASSTNGNVIEIPDHLPGGASSTNGNVIEIPDHLPGNASSTDGTVIEIPDHLPGDVSNANGNVIEIPDPICGDASNGNGNVIEIPDSVPGDASNANDASVPGSRTRTPNATETQANVIIEVPDRDHNAGQSSGSSTTSLPEVQFVSETRSESDETRPQNILDVHIITCDGENANNRPRNNEMLTELQSWFSMLSESCERRMAPRARVRPKKNSPNRENRAPAMNNESPAPEPSPSAPAEAPEPNGKKLGDCPICLDTLSASFLASTNCGHVFCLDCIKKSLSTTGKRCPTCRKQLKGVGYHQVFL